MRAVQGTLILTMGLRCTVSGTVLRIEDGAVVVKLERGPTHLRRHSRTAAPHQDVSGLEAAARLKMGTRDYLRPEFRERGFDARQQRHTIRHVDHISG